MRGEIEMNIRKLRTWKNSNLFSWVEGTFGDDTWWGGGMGLAGSQMAGQWGPEGPDGRGGRGSHHNINESPKWNSSLLDILLFSLNRFI